jgi:predicted membrane protein
MTQPPTHRGSYTAAAVLILVGALFLLNNVGYFPLGHILHLYWPCIFIAIGLIQIATNKGSGLGGGIFFILLGAFLQGIKLGWFSWNWHVYWPALLILIGLWIILKPHRGGWSGIRGGKDLNASKVNSFSLFSGVEQILHTEDFSGGEVTAIFGGAKYDMRDASTRQREIRLSVTVIFGGIELLVPSSWRVLNRITPVLGGVDEKRRPPLSPLPDDAPVLILEGAVVFGGLEIKD